jgi:ABC-type lipoprotein release transport system permease subunit
MDDRVAVEHVSKTYRTAQLSIVAATLASLYPAWRAVRLNVVEAVRHV